MVLKDLFRKSLSFCEKDNKNYLRSITFPLAKACLTSQDDRTPKKTLSEVEAIYVQNSKGQPFHYAKTSSIFHDS